MQFLQAMFKDARRRQRDEELFNSRSRHSSSRLVYTFHASVMKWTFRWPVVRQLLIDKLHLDPALLPPASLAELAELSEGASSELPALLMTQPVPSAMAGIEAGPSGGSADSSGRHSGDTRIVLGSQESSCSADAAAQYAGTDTAGQASSGVAAQAWDANHGLQHKRGVAVSKAATAASFQDGSAFRLQASNADVSGEQINAMQRACTDTPVRSVPGSLAAGGSNSGSAASARCSGSPTEARVSIQPDSAAAPFADPSAGRHMARVHSAPSSSNSVVLQAASQCADTGAAHTTRMSLMSQRQTTSAHFDSACPSTRRSVAFEALDDQQAGRHGEHHPHGSDASHLQALRPKRRSVLKPPSRHSTSMRSEPSLDGASHLFEAEAALQSRLSTVASGAAETPLCADKLTAPGFSRSPDVKQTTRDIPLTALHLQTLARQDTTNRQLHDALLTIFNAYVSTCVSTLSCSCQANARCLQLSQSV